MTRRRTGPIGLLPLLLALVLGAAAAAPIAPAAAQQPGDASVNAPEGQVAASDIVVIDFQGVVRESTAAQAVQDQLASLRRAYQDEFGRIEQDLRAIEQQLTEDRDRLPESEFAERRREFERRITEAQRRAQARRSVLDRALDQAMGRVRSRLLEVVAEIAGDRGAHIVLNKQQVVLTDRSLDITEAALARLNEVLPTIQVELPDEDEMPDDGASSPPPQ